MSPQGEASITVEPEIHGWFWWRLAGVMFNLGGWCLRRVKIEVLADGRKVRTMHPAATLKMSVDQRA